MNFILKIEGVDHKSQIITIDLSNQHFITTNFDNKEEGIQKYDGKEVYGDYIGKSRIDGFPMFKINTFSLDRDNKISQIIN